MLTSGSQAFTGSEPSAPNTLPKVTDVHTYMAVATTLDTTIMKTIEDYFPCLGWQQLRLVLRRT